MMMKATFVFLMALPFTAYAGSTSAPAKFKTPCRFSMLPWAHNQIEHTDKEKCDKVVCAHVVVCDGDKFAIPIYCKSKNGECEGYTADECIKNIVSVDAEYDTEKRTP